MANINTRNCQLTDHHFSFHENSPAVCHRSSFHSFTLIQTDPTKNRQTMVAEGEFAELNLRLSTYLLNKGFD